MGVQPYIFIEQQGFKDSFYYVGEIQVGSHGNADFLLAMGLNSFSAYAEEVPPLFPERGFPANASPQIKYKYRLVVDDKSALEFPEHGFVTREQAEQWIEKGLSHYLDNEKSYIKSPDFRSVSWLTALELEKVCDSQSESGEDNIVFRAIVAMLKVLNEGDDKRSRIVFWFL
jgi:hypothetical protein